MLAEIPVTSICTRSRIQEFLVTRYSLEQYHKVQWMVATDKESKEFLETLFPDDIYLELCEAEGTHHRGEYEPFLKVVMQKMAVMRQCIEDFGSTLFIDSDIVFTREMDLTKFSGAPLVYSSHHIPPSKITDMYGMYNVGFIFCKDTHFLDSWEQKTRAKFDPDGLEQKPFEYAVDESSIPKREFGRGYNVGWWRTYHDPQFASSLSVKNGKIFVGTDEATSFHVHTDPNVCRPDEDPFRALLDKILEVSGSAKHLELKKYMHSVYAR